MDKHFYHLFLVVICGWPVSARAGGIVLSFFEGSGHVYPTLQRTELVNLWYSQPVDYGMDCSLYSTGQYGVVILFRGDVVAEAFVSSCDADQLPKSLTVSAHRFGRHHVLDRFPDKEANFKFRGPHHFRKKNCAKKFFDQMKNKELYTDCVNGWCSFDGVVQDWREICIE